MMPYHSGFPGDTIPEIAMSEHKRALLTSQYLPGLVYLIGWFYQLALTLQPLFLFLPHISQNLAWVTLMPSIILASM